MKNLLMFLSLFLIAVLTAAGNPDTNPEVKKMEAKDKSKAKSKSNTKPNTKPNFTLTVLYDNYQFDENFRNSWGFSCLIEGAGKTILFDSGGNDGNLMHNFKAAGKDPSDVDLVVLSHIHWDHTRGLPEFLESKADIDVYIPASFPEEFKKELISKGANPVEINEFQGITDNVWTTGEMGKEIIEQSLILETKGGLVILTGCAHPGIVSIVEKSMNEKGNEVLLVMGGFHLLRTSIEAVEVIAQDFMDKNIKYASPTHCSGDGTISIFRETFGERYIQTGAGKVIHTADL